MRTHNASVVLDQPPSPLIDQQVHDSESSLENTYDRTSIDGSPFEVHRGSDGNPKEPNLKTSSLGAKADLAQSGSIVSPETDPLHPSLGLNSRPLLMWCTQI
ncbi:hypothetical protein L6452_31224 [Arctium lappa]|uniref:Uncharacterized protein n=1 Tax=Arctium lappa TaxID=4217 RepID=A0ACB8ZKP0_ARCLA|nr:hypothetical protein L6452_31224 [Arctium lappa]